MAMASSAVDKALKTNEIDDILNEIDNREQPSELIESTVDWTSIVKAMQSRNSGTIKKLIAQKEIDIDSQNPQNGFTLLIYAVIIGDVELVTTVCNFGADARIKDHQGMDALDYAVKFGRYKITELIFYRTLSGTVGGDLKNIAQVIHQRKRQFAFMEQTDAALLMKNQGELRFRILCFMIEAIEKRAVFDECMLFYAWCFVLKDEPNPLSSKLWKTMMRAYDSILSNTDDTNGWKWLKEQLLVSYIWYLPHPHHSTQADAVPTAAADDEKNNDDDSTDATLQKTLFWELLHRVRAESKKQSDLLLKERINAIKTTQTEQWNKLVEFDLDRETDAFKAARQDVCGCLTPKYSEAELSEERYPPSTHFSAKKHFDANIYLNQLLFVANVLDTEFQAAMKQVTTEINQEIGGTALYRAGPVKTLQRSQTKIENDYIAEAYPKSAKILDINRCALQFSDVDQMLRYVQVFIRKIAASQTQCIKQIVRYKNGWSAYDEAYPQYTDLKLNLFVRSQSDPDASIITEVQFLLTLMSAFKKKSHKLYAVERKFELVQNFAQFQQKMAGFKDLGDTHAVYMHLIDSGEFECFRLLWEMTRDGLTHPDAQSLLKDNAIIQIVSSKSEALHLYFMQRFRKPYVQAFAQVLSLPKMQQVLQIQDLALTQFADSSKNTPQDKIRILTRLLSICKDEFVDRDLSGVVKFFRSAFLKVIKDPLQQYFDDCFSSHQLQVPQNDILHFGDYEQTRLKFVAFTRALFVFGTGELGFGYGVNTQISQPQSLIACGEENIHRVSCGVNCDLAIDVNGEVYAWGSNEHGQCGLGQQDKLISTPRKLASFSQHKAVQICAGKTHSLILTQDGRVWSLGNSKDAVLGHGSKEHCHVHKRIESLSAGNVFITHIAAGHTHNGAVSKKGELFMWGASRNGQCGVKQRIVSIPTKVNFEDDKSIALRVECGWKHSVLLTTTGKMFSFGCGQRCALGHGDESDQFSPKMIEVLSSKNIVDIACGLWHNLCVIGSGESFSWGYNEHGQCGHGDNAKNEYFDDTNKIVACECGGNYSCVITEKKDLYMFGKGENNQLGIGSNPAKQTVPVKVESVSGLGIECVSLGSTHSAVILGEKVRENQSTEEEKENSGESIVLAPNESKQYQNASNEQCVAVYVKNESFLQSIDWFYLAEHRFLQ